MMIKIAAIMLVGAVVAILSNSVFPAGEVQRQIYVAALWFAAGFVVERIWRS